MGKYMKKSKRTRDVGVTEPIASRVLTRAAKNLALNSSPSPAQPESSSCYLQLRSRRFQKAPPLTQSRVKEPRIDSDSAPVASCGENSLDFESSYRESTPCNDVEDLEITLTPCSSTRSSATKDYTRDRGCTVPTASELEEFFTYAEQQQQRIFMEKYNFDFVNDRPLTGRCEWVQVML